MWFFFAESPFCLAVPPLITSRKVIPNGISISICSPSYCSPWSSGKGVQVQLCEGCQKVFSATNLFKWGAYLKLSIVSGRHLSLFHISHSFGLAFAFGRSYAAQLFGLVWVFHPNLRQQDMGAESWRRLYRMCPAWVVIESLHWIALQKHPKNPNHGHSIVPTMIQNTCSSCPRFFHCPGERGKLYRRYVIFSTAQDGPVPWRCCNWRITWDLFSSQREDVCTWSLVLRITGQQMVRPAAPATGDLVILYPPVNPCYIHHMPIASFPFFPPEASPPRWNRLRAYSSRVHASRGRP